MSKINKYENDLNIMLIHNVIKNFRFLLVWFYLCEITPKSLSAWTILL